MPSNATNGQTHGPGSTRRCCAPGPWRGTQHSATHSRSGAGQFDIKQDAGGIADIEFLVQYWVLAAAEGHPELLTYTDNIRQLEGLAAVGVLPPATAQWLRDAYIGYRTVLHHISLEGQGERVVEAAPYAGTRARVVEIWRDTFRQVE